MQVFGVPKSVGQIFGLLYASPEPLVFSDIVVRLEISKGSTSQGLQLLPSLGAINVAESRKSESGDPGQPKRGESQSKRIVEPSAINSRFHFHPYSGRGAPPRVAYEPELSLRKLMSGVIRERVTSLAAASADRLGRLSERAKSNGEADDFYLGRVEQLETWRKQLGAVDDRAAWPEESEVAFRMLMVSAWCPRVSLLPEATGRSCRESVSRRWMV